MDGDSEVIQLGDNLTKPVKIGSELPSEVKKTLIKWLMANADFFSISPYEIPDIDPIIVCLLWNVDPNALLCLAVNIEAISQESRDYHRKFWALTLGAIEHIHLGLIECKLHSRSGNPTTNIVVVWLYPSEANDTSDILRLYFDDKSITRRSNV